LPVPLTRDEYVALLEGTAPGLRLTGTYAGSGGAWDTAPTEISIERGLPVSLVVPPTPRLMYLPPQAGGESPAKIDLTSLTIRNPEGFPRTIREVLIFAADNEITPVLRIPAAQNRTIPAGHAGFRLDPIPLTTAQLRQFQGIAKPRIGVTVADTQVVSDLADLKHNLPGSQVRIVVANFGTPLPERIQIDAVIENPGSLPVTITGAQLRLTATDNQLAPTIPLTVTVEPGTKDLRVPVTFPVADLKTVLNSRVASLQLTLLQGDDVKLTTTVDTHTDPKGLSILDVVPIELARDRARLRFELRNDRTDPPLPADIIGVRAYPIGGQALDQPVRFGRPANLAPGATGTAEVSIDGNELVQRLLGRIVQFTPVEERDIARRDLYYPDRAVDEALSKIQIVVDNLDMTIGSVVSKAGQSEVVQAILSGSVRILADVSPPSDILDKIPLHIALVSAGGAEVARADTVTVGSLRASGADPLAPLSRHSFTIKYTEPSAVTIEEGYQRVERFLRDGFISANLDWPETIKSYREATHTKLVSVPLAMGSIPVIGWEWFNIKLLLPKLARTVSMLVSLGSLGMLIFSFAQYFIVNRSIGMKEFRQLSFDILKIFYGILAIFGLNIWQYFSFWYAILNYLIYGIVGLLLLAFLGSSVALLRYNSNRRNQFDEAQPLEEVILEKSFKMVWLFAIFLLIFLIPLFSHIVF
jgi:hypothetical protein